MEEGITYVLIANLLIRCESSDNTYNNKLEFGEKFIN
jgi:hypothetical protein